MEIEESIKLTRQGFEKSFKEEKFYNYKGKKPSRSEIKKDQIVNSDLVFTH